MDPTQQYYDHFADDFEKIPFNPLIQELVGRLVETPGALLDVGSGPGALAQEMKKAGFAVTCLDPAPKMVQRCREKGLESIEGTLDHLDRKDRFQIVLAVSSLIHVTQKDFEAALGTIGDHLIPDGKVVISMLLGAGEGMEDPLDKGMPRYFKYYSKEELETLFTSAGFQVIEEHEREVKRMGKRFAIYVLIHSNIF